MEAAKDLFAFIQVKTGTQELPISPATSLEQDLGVTGEEAVELLRAIALRYQVELRHFRWSKYFYAEPHLGATYLTVEPFTVGDILRAVEKGSFGPEYS